MSAHTDHKARTLWLSGVLHGFTHLYQIALAPLYLLIERGLKLQSVEQATLLVTVMGLAYFIPSYPMGVLADRCSRKKLMAIGLALNGLGYVCLGLSPNYPCALASVALSGFGGSFYHPAATALVARIYPTRTGWALGMVAIGASAGFFFSPIYSGWRGDVTNNWRYPVVELGALGIIFSAIFYWLAEEEPGGPVARVAKKAKDKLFPTSALWIFFVLMALAFSMRDFTGSAMVSLGSLFLQNAHGFNPRATGLILSGVFLASAVSNPVFGHLSDGGRTRWAISLLLVALTVVAVFPHVPKDWMFLALSAYGFFFMASYPVVEAALMESVPDAVRGRVFGLFITFGGLIGNLSHWLVGGFVKNLGARASDPSAYYTIYVVLAGLIVVSLLGLPCMRAIRKREGLDRAAHAQSGIQTDLHTPHPTLSPLRGEGNEP
jgi:MFS family permease